MEANEMQREQNRSAEGMVRFRPLFVLWRCAHKGTPQLTVSINLFDSVSWFLFFFVHLRSRINVLETLHTRSHNLRSKQKISSGFSYFLLY